MSYPLSTDHPYANNASLYWIVEAPGATEMKIHYDWLDVEQGYDYAHIADREGNAYASYTGNLGEFVSDPIAADEVVLWLITDYIRWGQRDGIAHADLDPEAWLNHVLNLSVAMVAFAPVRSGFGGVEVEGALERQKAELVRLTRAALLTDPGCTCSQDS